MIRGSLSADEEYGLWERRKAGTTKCGMRQLRQCDARTGAMVQARSDTRDLIPNTDREDCIVKDVDIYMTKVRGVYGYKI